MADDDLRSVSRDSLFLLAELRQGGGDAPQRVRVRNLSAGGMMAEGANQVVRGAPVQVNLRNIGWVHGAVAWVQGDRCGIAFRDEIDPLAARAPVIAGEGTPRFAKPPLAAGKPDERLRKI